MRRFLWIVMISVLMAQAPAFASPKFEAFIESLWPRVKAAGISRDLFNQAFAGITEPDQQVLELARKQPEFTSTTSAYLAKAVTPIRIDTGQTQKSSDAAAARSDRKKIWRGSAHPSQYLGNGIKFRQRQGIDERLALARHTDLLRFQAEICQWTVDRSVQNSAKRPSDSRQFYRVLGCRNGPYAIHPDIVSVICS